MVKFLFKILVILLVSIAFFGFLLIKYTGIPIQQVPGEFLNQYSIEEPTIEPQEAPKAEISASREEWLSTPQQIDINSKTYYLDTYLWRDFMPISPADGKPLLAHVEVITKDGSEPSSLGGIRQLWVINNEEIWEANLTTDEEVRYSTGMNNMARDGPKWGPGIPVDVVVRVMDMENNSYFLKASNQMIHRTD